MDEADFSCYLKLALRLAKESGEKIRKAFYEGNSGDIYENGVIFKGLIDLVTQTDKEVEDFIINSIKQEYPNHCFLAEESYDGLSYNLTDEPTWIIDPIDGTTNFVHRYPLVCVSIGFAIKKRVVVGVVYNPVLNELYEAIVGKGSLLNGKRIHVSNCSQIHKSLIATNVGYDRTAEGIQFMLNNIRNLLECNVQSIRSQGTAALDLCAVACGRIDCFYEFGIHPWDIAAGMLIVQEAGGHVIDPLTSKEPVHLEVRRVLAGNAIINGVILDTLKQTPVPKKHKLMEI